MRPVRTLFRRRDPREQILRSADKLFYRDGIRVTTVDHIITDAKVSRGAFYAAYATKESLVFDYIKSHHESDVKLLAAMYDSEMTPGQMLRTVLDEIVSKINHPDFHGCVFINAAAEFPDRRHPIRIAIRTHREWYSTVTTDLLRDAGHPLPGDAADDLVIVRDGGMSSSHSGDPVAAAAAMQRAIDRALQQLQQHRADQTVR